MSNIVILNQHLDLASKLAKYCNARRVDVTLSNDAHSIKAQTLVLSSQFEKKCGGQKPLMDQLRSLGLKRVIILTEDSNKFEISSDLGGRILRISIPNNGDLAEHNCALFHVTDILCRDTAPIVAADQASSTLIDIATRVAKTDVTVFINGPTGSGKEVMARHVHINSKRADKAFVAINCAAIPENMLEAILFGHEKGSFTGATTANKGIIRAADGGTLFLDEVTEMPMGLQSKLLRVLQEKKVTPVGSQKEEAVDIRVIATSNRNMIDAVKEGTFREDLYYRLNVFPLETLPLSKRASDIAALSAALISRHTSADSNPPLITQSALKALETHDWPGNVRELENIIQRAMVLHNGQIIDACDIMITPTIPAAKCLPQVATAFAAE